MAYGLDADFLPNYCFSAYKNFEPNEKHITRICDEDVLILMLDGVLYFNENNIPIELHKNQYYIQKSGIMQEGIIPSGTAKYYYIHFNGKFCDNENALPLLGFFDTKPNISLYETLDFLQISNGTAVEKAACFYQILSNLKKSIPESEERQLVIGIISEIVNNIQKHYSLEEIANIFGYSKNHIINIFKKETGKTPYSYITDIRIDKAKALLAYSNTPINLIAEQTGFISYINFYKKFIELEGINPAEWRKSRKL